MLGIVTGKRETRINQDLMTQEEKQRTLQGRDKRVEYSVGRVWGSPRTVRVQGTPSFSILCSGHKELFTFFLLPEMLPSTRPTPTHP